MPSDNQTSKLKVGYRDLQDKEVYRLNQVIGHLQQQIDELTNGARLTGVLSVDSIKSKLPAGVPGDHDVVPWGTIKKYLSPAATRQAWVKNNWLGTPVRPIVLGGGDSSTAVSGATYFQEEILAANTTITASVIATVGSILVMYVTQGAGPYTISFEPTEFSQSMPTNIEPTDGSVTVFVWGGRADGLWWPMGWPMTGLLP